MGSICTINVGDEDPPLAEAIANAHLIAAAPELYEALEKIVTAAINYDDANSLCFLGEKLMPILAKARGEA